MARKIKIVHMKILGGWFLVRGPRWTPLAGPFATKAEVKAWLERKIGAVKWKGGSNV
jgi:hypothetical protein